VIEQDLTYSRIGLGKMGWFNGNISKYVFVDVFVTSDCCCGEGDYCLSSGLSTETDFGEEGVTETKCQSAGEGRAGLRGYAGSRRRTPSLSLFTAKLPVAVMDMFNNTLDKEAGRRRY